MSFEALKLTNKGQELLLRSLEGATITFTAIKVGDGTTTADAISELTDLINAVHTTEITAATRTSQYMMVEGVFNNSEIPRSFYWREVGIYTADPDAPDDRSRDILFMYQNAFDTAEYISISSGEIIEKAVRLNVFVGEAERVEATIDPATATVSKAYLDDVISDINETINEKTAGLAAEDHDHEISDVNGLQSALNNKAPQEHGHQVDDISDFPNTINMAWNTRELILSDSDLDNYTQTGCFLVLDSSTSAAINNTAYADSGYYLDVWRRSETMLFQVATTWVGLQKIRHKSNGIWSDWAFTKDGGNAGSADKIKTVKNDYATTGAMYPTFVDSNNASATAEAAKTDYNVRYNIRRGTTSEVGIAQLCLGSITPQGQADNSRGIVLIYGEDAYYVNLSASQSMTGNVDIRLPNTSGTLALNTPASAAVAGLVNTIAQTFAGAKTFNGPVYPNGATDPGIPQARKLASGSAEANDTNCPANSWYGQHV